MDSNLLRCKSCGTVNRILREKVLDSPRCASCKTALVFYNDVVSADDNTFQKAVLNEPGAVLVDFWSETCGYCKMMEPLLHKLAKEFSGMLKVVSVNVSEAQQVAARHGIQGVPSFALYKGGRMIRMQPGAMNELQFRQWLDQHLA